MYPKVIKIEYIRTIIPNCSSGTGYSEPDVFKFWLDDNNSFTSCIDTWYHSSKMIVQICREAVSKMPILNQEETVEMLLNYYYDKNTSN